MSKEQDIPLQHDMFSGGKVDTRTRRQRQRAREREKPKPLEMFSSRELAQFGINPRPLIELSPHTKLSLFREDPRTEEEIERDRQRAAERDTHRMFESSPELYDEETASDDAAASANKPADTSTP